MTTSFPKDAAAIESPTGMKIFPARLCVPLHRKARLDPVVAVIVCLAYISGNSDDNSYARMKWQIAINASWIVAVTLGFVNLLVLYFMG
jgi:hypothetical protein